LDGIGTAPDKEVLKRLAAAFDTHFDPELPLPYLYPTPEDGIQAEWSLNENAWSIGRLLLKLPRRVWRLNTKL
jgi:hypothetical protein